MSAPRLSVTYKDVEYSIELRGQAWVIAVAGGHYLLTENGDPDDAAARFFRARMRNVPDPPRPAFVASSKYPLLLKIDAILVRAWPALRPRGDRPETFVHPHLERRVGALRGPVWMFAARGREASEGGEVSPEQDVADVAALARTWVTSSAWGR